MRRSRTFLIGCTLFCLAVYLLSYNARETTAQIVRTPREYIIAIKGDLSDTSLITGLSPREVSVGRGDPVTWINESQVAVRMRFGKGTQCRQVSVRSLGWRLEPDKCYETKDTLKAGESTTIRFKEVGVFHYEVEYVDRNRREKGVIRVQTENP